MKIFKPCLGVMPWRQQIPEVAEKTEDQKIAECQEKYDISNEKLQEYRKSFNMLNKDKNGK